MYTEYTEGVEKANREEKPPFETICEGEWVAIRTVELAKDYIYEYSHDLKCNGRAVAVLVYRNDQTTPIMGSFEVIPCHFDGKQLVTVTGMIDGGDDPFETAVKEVHEECGYKIEKNELFYLGIVMPLKSSDKIIHLFSVDVTNKERYERSGDGTPGEEMSHCDWVEIQDCLLSKDPLFAVMISRMNMLIESQKQKQEKKQDDIQDVDYKMIDGEEIKKD